MEDSLVATKSRLAGSRAFPNTTDREVDEPRQKRIDRSKNYPKMGRGKKWLWMVEKEERTRVERR